MKQRYFDDAVNFLKNIKKTDGVVIVFNNDGDGICSCALIMSYLEREGHKKPYIITQPMPMDKNLIQRIKTTVPNKIIFLDLVVDQQEDVAKRVKGFGDILIIDHHQIQKNLNSKTMVHFNPRFTDSKVYTSTTYNAYKICSELTDMSDLLWLAAVGIISDYALEDSEDLVKEIKKTYDVGELYPSFLGRIADMIFSTRATKEMSCEQMVEFFLKVKDPKKLEEVEGHGKLIRSYHIIDEELKAIMTDALANTEKDGRLVLYKIQSKYNLDSIISTKLSERHLDKLLLVYSRNGPKYKVSARNQKKNINAGEVMKKACEGIDAKGGGHEAAAGATVNEKDWDKFLEKVRELANKE